MPGRLLRRIGAITGLVAIGFVIFVILLGRSATTPDDAPGQGKGPVRTVRTLATSPRRSFYVAPTGVAGTEGSRSHPLDLASVLSVNTPAAPGDTIWLREGTYSGPFTSELRGTEADPIVVRAVPGERVVIDAGQTTAPAVTVNGESVWFAGFEVMNSKPLRINSGTTPGLRPDLGIVSRGAHIKFINLLVHDLAGGIDLGVDAADNEAYGNLVYFNGWQGRDVGEGFGIRSPNRTGSRLIRDNIIFDQFAVGLLAFGAAVDNLTLDGNVFFNNGQLSPFFDRHILVGGGAHNLVASHNMSYYSGGPDVKGEGINIGMDNGCTNARITDNYFAGSSPLNLTNCKPTEMRGNTLYGRLAISPQAYPGNVLVSTLANPPAAAMTGVKAFVRPNAYDPGRASLIVYNWSRVPEVSVDLTGANIKKGERYEIRDAQNYFDAPLTITYDGGRVNVPMNNRKLTEPLGQIARAAVHTAPEFAVFVIGPASAAAPTTTAER
jgi:hypothetical protein